MKKEDVKNLDDLAEYFFKEAREIGLPLKSIKLKLKD